MAHFFSGKPLILFSTALVLLISAALYFFISARSGPWHAIPETMPLVMEFNSLQQAEQLITTSGHRGWEALLESEIFRTNREDLDLMKSLFGAQAGFVWTMQKGRLLAAYSLQEADSLHGLYITEPGKTFQLETALAQNPRTQKYFPATFHNHTLYTVWFSKSDRIVMCQLDNLLLFSRFSYLVEEAITQTESRSSWWADRPYEHELNPVAPFRFFLRPETLSQALRNKINPALDHVPDLISANLEWFGLCWDGQQVQMMAETKGYLKRVSSFGTPPPGNLFSVIPDHTALLAWIGFEDTAAFSQATDDEDAANFQTYILPWLGSGVACAVTEPRSPGLMDDELLFFQVADSAQAMRRLQDYGQKQGMIRHDMYQMFDVFEFVNPSLLAPVLQRKMAFKTPACAMLGDYVVFAPNRSALEVCIDKYIVNQTLASNVDFAQMWNKLPQDANNGLVVLNNHFFILLSQNFLSNLNAPDYKNILEKISDSGFNGAVLRMPEPGKMVIQTAGHQTVQRVAQTGILWKTPLESTVHAAPNLVATSSGDYLFVQDIQHRLYCLDEGGVVLWRRQMEGPLLSAVQSVGNPGQTTPNFVFNTQAHIWLIDEKGQDVGRFPIALRSPATNGILAVDFDKNLKFNYFVACENENLYGFDHTGSALPGWNPNRDAGKIVHPMLHFQEDGKDFLVALNKAAQLMVYGRNGQPRFNAVALSGRFASPPQVDLRSQSARIACFNTQGKVFVCNTSGSVSSAQVGANDPKTLGLFMTLTEGEKAGFTVLQGRRLRTKTYQGNTLKSGFDMELPVLQDTLFEVAGNNIGLLAQNRQQIYLIDNHGHMRIDFPLAGTSPFLLKPLRTGSKESVLIVANNNQLYAYSIR
ncbi:MAG: DUF3352 domain-containing protein [Saprospiraceae bacterium]|nr:DUF3352 domain-containing protein [Saprospiraceae bacterium]